ncbi:MAG TPA: hypothetical protein VK943_13890 [Arenibaculum sp.]|nr:hypothetical protein [Arenibaculum sp.]
MIPPRLHGVLDYAAAASLVALPRFLGWPARLRRPLDAAAAVTVGYSLCTDYELGAVCLLPMRTHLALDALQGTAFCIAAAALPEERRVRGLLAGYGAFCLAAAALTDTGRPRTARLGTGPSRFGWWKPAPTAEERRRMVTEAI